jgi:hypothetical protein
MTRPTKEQMAGVRSALREIRAELMGWDPHILVGFRSEAQKAQITERVRQLGWHYVADPGNDDAGIVEFSLDADENDRSIP